jgi:hypothetical protein
MSIIKAFSDGWRKVWQTRRWLVLLFVLQFVLVLFPGVALREAIEESLGKSLAAENMLRSFDTSWYQVFLKDAGKLESTFGPQISGAGAILESLDRLVTGKLAGIPALLFGLAVVYLLFWIFFSGGLIHQYGFGEENSFFALAARYFWRILGIVLLAGAAYAIIFMVLLPFFSQIVENITRQTIDERVHFALTVVKYLILWSLVVVVNLLADYAKIHAVGQNLASPFLAIGRAARFVFRHFFKTIGLYLLVAATGLFGMVFYLITAPGATHSSWGMILFGLFWGELYVLWRIFVRAEFLAAQTTLILQAEE